MKYDIIIESGSKGLISKVNNLLNKGWEPLGSPKWDGNHYHQAMILKADRAVEPMTTQEMEPRVVEIDGETEISLCDTFTVYEQWGSQGVSLGYDTDHKLIAIRIPGIVKDYIPHLRKIT